MRTRPASIVVIIALTLCAAGCVFLDPSFYSALSAPSESQGIFAGSPPKAGGLEDRVRAAAAYSIDLENSAIKELTSRVAKDPGKALPLLVKELTKGLSDPFFKLKAIHQWIGLNIAYDVDALLGRSQMVVEPYAVLKRGATVCQGYSELTQAMCALAGIKCEIVSGYARAYNWDANMAKAKTPTGSNHAWNAVMIEDGWYLLDVTWDSGYVTSATSSMKFVRAYDTQYFCADPRGFLGEHLPDLQAWQLLESPIDASNYVNYPKLHPIFYELGLELSSSLKVYQRVSDRFSFSFKAPKDTEFYVMASLEGSREATSAIVAESTLGEERVFNCTFPKAGAYLFSIMGWKSGKEGRLGESKQIVETYVEASSGTTLAFPELPSTFALKSPLTPYDTRVGARTEIVFSAPEGFRVDATLMKRTSISANGSSVTYNSCPNRTFTRKSGSDWAIMVSFPSAGSFNLLILERQYKDDGSWVSNTVATLYFIATEGSPIEFPYVYRPESVEVRAPLACPLAKGSEVYFEFYAPGTKEMIVWGESDKSSQKLIEGPAGVFTGKARISSEKVYAYVMEGGVYQAVAMFSAK